MIILIWLLRLVIYGGFAILSLGVIAPAIGGQVGIFASAPLAGLAVFLDLFLTSKIRKTSIENVVSSRFLLVDSVLTDKGKEADEKVLEIEGEVVEPYKIEEKD